MAFSSFIKWPFSKDVFVQFVYTEVSFACVPLLSMQDKVTHFFLLTFQVMSGTPLRPGMTVIRAPLQQSALGKTIIRTPVVVQQGILPASRLIFILKFPVCKAHGLCLHFKIIIISSIVVQTFCVKDFALNY